ncbi:MAG: hypothetical protein J0L57_00795 [Burkholderiales bacterium]|nr:hypothetical protein [Burkholderiales bacterium]
MEAESKGTSKGPGRVAREDRLPCGMMVLAISGVLTSAGCARMVAAALQGPPHGRRVALLLDLRRCVVSYDPNDSADPALAAGISRLVPIAFLIGPEQAWFGDGVRRLARRVGALRRCFATTPEAFAWLAEEADLSAATVESMGRDRARGDAPFQKMLARLVSSGDRPAARP